MGGIEAECCECAIFGLRLRVGVINRLLVYRQSNQ